MHPADRYAALLPPGVRERLDLDVPADWSELELQAFWFAGDFGRDFRTTEGDPVHIVQFGVWNHEAGPDFSHAAVSIAGGPAITGPLEFDIEARDWERHGHALNPAYEDVVLHVYLRPGQSEFFTRTLQHRRVPQVLLEAGGLRGGAPMHLPEARLGACAGPLGALPEDRARAVLLGAAEYRLKRKAAVLARLTEAHGAEEALYQSLATVLGYKSNKLPFTLLAQRLPLRLLLENREEIDALLFGVSGFLTEPSFHDLPRDAQAYVRGLWEVWWRRRAEFARLELAPELWQMSGQRPANHPQRRLAALAQIIRHWRELQRLVARNEPSALPEFFAKLHDPFWNNHYTLLSKPAARSMALLGDSRITEAMLNVFLPLAAQQSDDALGAYKKMRAALTNRRVEVAAVRLFGEKGERHALLKSAAVQQGLLQIYEDFCLQDASDCALCPFPRQVAQW